MKTTLRNLLLFFMLTVFLAGMNGVSFYVHECSHSNLREVFAFREIFSQQGTCCCGDDSPAVDPGMPLLAFSEESCCKSSFIYLKVTVSALPVVSTEKTDHSLVNAVSELPGISTLVETDSPVLIPSVKHHPPPVSGRSIVLRLHQIKIPVSIS